MIYSRSDAGLVVCADSFSLEATECVDAEFACGGTPGLRPLPVFSLIICDPGYGKITNESWDVARYNEWFEHCVSVAAYSSTIVMWGGIGKRRDRPFLHFAADVENRWPAWEIKNWITWGKKRAYGVQDNYLFTREECLIIIRGKPTFNIPYLDKKRGYAGYDLDYPAHSEFLRRTNVWSDITELFKGKIHPTQKPDILFQVLVEAHSNPGDVVYDPTGGSLTTMRAAVACGRRYCVIERERKYCEAAGVVF